MLMTASTWAMIEVTVGSFQQTVKGTHIYKAAESTPLFIWFIATIDLKTKKNEFLEAINNIVVGICRVRGFHCINYRLYNHDGKFKFIINYMYLVDQMFSNEDLFRNSLPPKLPFQRRKKNRNVD